MHHDDLSQHEVDTVIIEELTVAVDLPVGWTVDFDSDLQRLIVVGEATAWCVSNLCPSITLRAVPFPGGVEEFRSLAQATLDEMPSHYQDFQVRWHDFVGDHQSLRCYSFHLRPLDQPVTQLQGLTEATNAAIIYVIDCSAPSSTFGELESLFRHVALSIDPLGPDYVVTEV